MTEVVGVPVELRILTISAQAGVEMETSNAAYYEIIEETLNDNLQNSELVDFTFEVGNPFIVEATITTELDSTSEELLAEIEAVEDALSEALGITVLLDITVHPKGES